MTPMALSLSPSPPMASSSRLPSTAAVPVIGGSGARVPTQFLDKNGDFPSRIAKQEQTRANGNGNGNGNGRATSVGEHAPASLTTTVDLTGDDGDDFTLVDARGPNVFQNPDGQVCVGLINAVVMTMFGLPEAFISAPPARLSDFNAHPKWKTADWPIGSEFYLEPGYRPVELVVRGGGSTRSLPGEKADIQVHEIVAPMDVQQQLQGTGKPIPKGPQLKSSSFGSLVEKYNKGLHALLVRRMVKITARCRIVAPNSAQVSVSMSIFC
jgi:hypothetical protein